MRLMHSLTAKNRDRTFDAAYRYDLPQLIKREIYPHIPKAARGKWVLGKLHDEWNELWNKYNGIVLKAPRNHLKTFFFFEANALRVCDEFPEIEILYLTGSDSLAIKKLDNVKRYAKVPRFKHLLAGADINNKTELQFGNGSRISVQGFWSKGRGGHPDIIILDDPIDTQVAYSPDINEKSKERLATEILPMLNPDGKIVIAGTIQCENDLYSIDFNELQLEDGTKLNWVSRTYDAIVDEEKQITLFPEKWSWNALMAKKAEVVKFSGERFFNKEYRNMAVNLLGEIIKPEWLKTYTELPKGLSKYSGWDLSVGKKIGQGDFTAKVSFAVDGGQELPNFYITSVFNERLDFAKRVRAMITQGESEQPVAIGVEDNVFQVDTVQVAKKNSTLNIKGVTTTQNKIEKFMQTLTPLFENGRVFLNMNDPAQKKFWEQLCALPNGAFDDMADAFCNGLRVIPKLTRARDVVIVV